MKTDGNGSMRDPQIGEDDRWYVRIVRQLFGEERDSTREATEEHFTCLAPVARVHSSKIVSRKTIFHRVVLKLPRLGIEAGDPFVGAHPKIATVISQNAAHHIARKSILLVEGGKRERFPIQPVQSVLRTDPQSSSVVFEDG